MATEIQHALKNGKDCPNHRMIMVSSELVWPSRYQYGEPKAQIVTWRCLSCNESRTIEFKEPGK